MFFHYQFNYVCIFYYVNQLAFRSILQHKKVGTSHFERTCEIKLFFIIGNQLSRWFETTLSPHRIHVIFIVLMKDWWDTHQQEPFWIGSFTLYTQGGVFLAKFRQIGVVVPLILKSLFTVIIIKLVYFLRATPFERRPDAGRKSRGVRNWQQLVLRRSFCRALTRGSSLILISSNNFCAIIRSNALCKIRPKIAHPPSREIDSVWSRPKFFFITKCLCNTYKVYPFNGCYPKLDVRPSIVFYVRSISRVRRRTLAILIMNP